MNYFTLTRQQDETQSLTPAVCVLVLDLLSLLIYATHTHTHTLCGDLEGVPAWHKGHLHASGKVAEGQSSRNSTMRHFEPVRGKWHLRFPSPSRDDLRYNLAGFVTGGR